MRKNIEFDTSKKKKTKTSVRPSVSKYQLNSTHTSEFCSALSEVVRRTAANVAYQLDGKISEI